MLRNYFRIVTYRARKLAYSALFHSGILAHKTRVDWEETCHISCYEDEVSPLFNCSNNLYYIKTSQVEGFFRPVLPHLSISKCVRQAVEEYYTNIHPEQTFEKDILEKTLADKRMFKKLLCCGNYSEPYSRARKFFLSNDTTIIGIMPPPSLQNGTEEWKSYIKNIRSVLKYVINAINRHQRNIRGGRWEFSNANRQMATEAMAALLGLDYMIPHSKFVVITLPEYSMHGTLMCVAKGESTEGIKYERSRAVASPILQRELINLNILDAITYERDHRPGNYNMVLDNNGKVCEISVFDNDAAMTFAPFSLSSHSGSGCSNIRDNNHMINRPYMDKHLAERIIYLKRKEVYLALKPYLNRIQIVFCWKRIEELKIAIKRSIKQEGFLLDSDQWSIATMEKELSGEYGKTYLVKFIDNEIINKVQIDFYSVGALNY